MPGLNKPNKIIVHHFGGTEANPLADSSKATAQEVDSWHKARWPGFTSQEFRNDNGELYHVGYHFVIERNGKIVQCRGYKEEGAHCIGQNKSSIGVALAGNFDLTRPTAAQEKSFVKLYRQIKAAYPDISAEDIYPHRKYANKTCYGRNLDDDHFSRLVSEEPEPLTIKQLQEIVIQLSTQLLQLIIKKRMSSREI